MSLQHILILTSAHLCRNPRVVKEATTLGAAGYNVTVMSISVQPRFEHLDRELMRGLPFKRVTIDYTAGTITARLTDFLQRGATWAARQLLARIGWETAQALGPAGALLRRARRFPSDLLIAHTEIPLWAAQRLIADGRRVAVDLEDWYSQDLLPGDRRSRPLRLLREAESFALHRAAYVSTTSASLALALTKANGGRPPIVLRNTFPLQPTPRRTPGSLPRFIWFSQTVGPGRGLEQFLAAWAVTTQRSEVFLLGEARPGYTARLMDLIPPKRRSDLNFIPPVAPADLPSKLAEFDLGLALEPYEPPNKELTTSNKILQYLNAGLAVIATDTAGQREVMQAAPGCGVVADSTEAVSWARQLDAVLGDSAQLRRMQQAARTAAEREFCWEHDAPRLLAAVARALSVPPPAA